MNDVPIPPSDRIIGLYEDQAAAWDRQRDRDLYERIWLERFTALLPRGGEVLDLGCGMGEPIARHFIQAGFRVIGLDSAPSLIALCRTRFPDHEWLVGDMRELDFARRFDGILAWHSFFHLTPADQQSMFARFAAHARPGAALMFTSGWSHGQAIGSWRGEPLYHGSLDPGEYRALLAENGFEVLRHVVQDPGCGQATIWLARIRATVPGGGRSLD